MSAAIDELVDLSDLDLLDDDQRHIYCSKCHGDIPNVGLARCGKRGFCHGQTIADVGLPPNICAPCLKAALQQQACPRCGQ